MKALRLPNNIKTDVLERRMWVYNYVSKFRRPRIFDTFLADTVDTI